MPQQQVQARMKPWKLWIEPVIGPAVEPFRGVALLALSFPFCLYVAGCSVSSSAPVASSPQASQAAASTGEIPTTFFGMVVKAPARVPSVATGARRLWDSGVTWAALEPSPGSFNWATLDAEVNAAQHAGEQVTLTLGMTPQWASSHPAVASGYGAGATEMPANLVSWDSYLTAVSTRYAGRIAAYEVWNAPENVAYWTGSPALLGENMATLSSHVAGIVHQTDPSALIVSPALSPTGLSAFLMAGGGSTIDVVGASLGSSGDGTATPETMVATLQAMRSLLAGTSAESRPIWNDQASWTLPRGGLAMSVQAAYVARSLLLNAGLGVQRVHWYAWDEGATNALALTDAQQLPTPAANAYSQVQSWVSGAQMNGCAATASGVWTCQIVRSGKTEWILWAASGTINSSSLGATTATDLQGNVTTVDGSIVVGASPVLLQ